VTPQRRELIFTVMDNHYPLLGLLSILHRHPRCDDVLRWLVNRGYTGKVLEDWFRHKFAPDPKKLIAHVLRHQGPTLILNRHG
jgi:uncharacterized membrane protein YbaN (DUF454 family)